MSDITACKHDFSNNLGFLTAKSDAQLTFVSNLHKTRSRCPHGRKKECFLEVQTHQRQFTEVVGGADESCAG